ncbi:ATP-dependent DNA ligase [Nocardia nova]|uniref:DNA ligase (ATP) n=1 Tax=Nocardia nova TaxID=37330 RepID=A0A2S6AMG1_9NOCA|nr:non-homologous end-joining DNA ligase [Nocardia nova]PPJ36431.1 ATP-dependent DNA ligase [Nocardia nova]
MLAISGKPPDSADWAVEMKWDGARILAICRNGQCRLFSRNQRELTASFPDITQAVIDRAGGRELIVDGEVVSQTSTGAPQFGLLQRRLHVRRPSRELLRTVPAQLFAFDLLGQDGVSTMGEAYLTRRERLDALALAGPHLTVPPFWRDVPAEQLLTVAAEHHLEGIVSKRVNSSYRPGRSRSWVKTVLRQRLEAIVVAHLPSGSSATAGFGALVLAAHDPAGELVYLGTVGTGWSNAERRSLRAQFDRLAAAEPTIAGPVPHTVAAAARWIHPGLVATIEYREATIGGLRHPSWIGLRDDIDPDQVFLP